MSITISSTFNNPNLPSGLPYDQQLLADPALKNWFQADANAVTFGASPAIASFLDKKSTGAAFTQPAAADQASLAASQIAGYSAALFNGTSDTYPLTLSGTATDLDETTTFSLVWFGVPAATGASSQALMSKLTAGTPNVGFMVAALPAGTIQFIYGATSITTPFITGPATPLLMSASFNLPQELIKLRVNGVSAVPVAAAATTESANPFYLGKQGGGTAFLSGLFSDLMVRTDDIFSNPTALDLTEKFFVRTYGLGFTPA